MSRQRRAADARTPRNPDSPDFAEPDPNWSSLTDTGSLKPSDEALDWQRRADQWAQQAESDDHQAVEPANRWSDAASTGRTTFPADGVGWRTETAEWRATGARWRQTTEWRSTTGSHVWRSTTEAWQTGGNSAYPDDAETPMSQPAIASTAWSEESNSDSRPAWQQFADPSNEPEPDRRRSLPAESAQPSWQQPSPRTPAESSPSWQQLVDPPQPQPRDSRPSWQRDAIEGSATWTDLTDQRSAPAPAPADSGTTWLRTENPDDGRHLVREDDRAAWRRDSGGGSPQVGRRRAPEPGSAPSGGTGWSAARPENESWENTDGWARHTDTGGIQLYGDTPAPPSTSWGTGTGFGSRNVNRREDTGRRQLPSAYGDSPAYEVPPATPYEPPPRPPRRDDTASARALPPGGYDETPRQRYAPDDDQPRYADEAQGSRSRRSRRYAEEPDGAPAAGSYAPPEPRAPRRSRPEQRDDSGAFGAVPMPAPQPTSAPRSAVPMPAPRSAVPAPGDTPRNGPPKGRAKYNGGGNDWREQTGSWEAEPDTSSWVRDPDTGQWSRSDDDPRILAWRREAARREAMGEGPRALPAPPPAAMEPEIGPEPRPEPPAAAGWRNRPPAPLPPGPTPRSATPYTEPGYASTSSGSRRDSYETSGGYGVAPASSVPYDQPRDYGSGTSGRDSYDPARDYDSGPTRSVPSRDYDSGPTRSLPDRDPYGSGPARSARGRDSYEAPSRGYDAAPAGPAPYDEPRDYGNEIPGRDPYGYGAAPADQSRGYGGAGSRRGYRDDEPGNAPRSGPAAPYSGQRALPSAPRSAPGYDGPSAPASGIPGGPIGYSGGSAAPRSAPGYSGGAAAPRSAPGYSGGSASPRSAPGYSGGSAAPRSAPGYSGGSAAPRSAPGYSGGSAAPRSAPGYSGGSAAPRSAPGYSGSASAQVSSVPADTSRYSSGAAPSGGLIPLEEPRRSGRRRAEDDEPTRRNAAGPGGYAEPLSPATWQQPGPDSRTNRPGRADDVPSWSSDETEAPPEPDSGAWHLEERRERARGSAMYRDGGGGDWRRDLADQSDLAEGESRRFGTSDYVPFRSSGSAAVTGQSNLSTTSTSLISPIGRDSAPREAATGPAQRAAASWNGPSGAYERRPVTGGYPTGRKSDLLDPDDEEDEQGSGSPLAVVGYTVIWYGVPVVLFIAYMLVVGAGGQGHALGTLAKAAPQFLISLVLSVLVAIGLRFVSQSWKAISVGLAAAVVGGGLATVLTSAITGNSLS
ncbi:hypothetical protein [Actinoplanes solisilvae]|uniref:hypothetical protein n=1 Tax=Actinoplanes solisilvae TaxID=2486853 RepID=UPI000FD766E5|nr:hypothetical protein [Actinoplanes solisilvae]